MYVCIFFILVRIPYCPNRKTTHVCIVASHILMHIHTVYIYCSTNMLHVLWVIAHLLYTRIQYICMHNTCKWRIARLYMYCTVHTGARVHRV